MINVARRLDSLEKSQDRNQILPLARNDSFLLAAIPNVCPPLSLRLDIELPISCSGLLFSNSKPICPSVGANFIQKPNKFLENVFESADAPEELHFAKGTTTLGFVFDQGIVITVDSRSTQGDYIGEKNLLSLFLSSTVSSPCPGP